MLEPIGGKKESYRGWVDWLSLPAGQLRTNRASQDFAQGDADRPTAWLARDHRLLVLSFKPAGKGMTLGGRARSVDAFKDDESPAPFFNGHLASTSLQPKSRRVIPAGHASLKALSVRLDGFNSTSR
jgi:hypothetical protein